MKGFFFYSLPFPTPLFNFNPKYIPVSRFHSIFFFKSFPFTMEYKLLTVKILYICIVIDIHT